MKLCAAIIIALGCFLIKTLGSALPELAQVPCGIYFEGGQ